MTEKRRSIAFYSTSKTFAALAISLTLSVAPVLPQIRDKSRMFYFMHEVPGIIVLYTICLMFLLFAVMAVPKLFRAIFKLPAIYVNEKFLVSHSGFRAETIPVSEIRNCGLITKNHVIINLFNGKEKSIPVGFVLDEERVKRDISSLFNFGES